MSKKPVSMRLSVATVKELEALAKRYKASQADVVAILVHCVHRYGEVDDERLEELFAVAERC